MMIFRNPRLLLPLVSWAAFMLSSVVLSKAGVIDSPFVPLQMIATIGAMEAIRVFLCVVLMVVALFACYSGALGYSDDWLSGAIILMGVPALQSFTAILGGSPVFGGSSMEESLYLGVGVFLLGLFAALAYLFFPRRWEGFYPPSVEPEVESGGDDDGEGGWLEIGTLRFGEMEMRGYQDAPEDLVCECDCGCRRCNR